MTRLGVIFVCIIGFALACSFGFAQGMDDVKNAEDAFGSTLGGLKESVNKLADENKALSLTNENLRVKAKALKDELEGIKKQEAGLQERQSEIESRWQKKRDGLIALEEQLASLKLEMERVNKEQLGFETESKERWKKENALQNQISALEAELAGLNFNEMSDQEVNAEELRLKTMRTRLQQENQEAVSQLSQKKREWDLLSAGMDSEQLPSLRQVRDNYSAEIAALNIELAKLRKTLNDGQVALDQNVPENISSEQLSTMVSEVSMREESVKVLEKEVLLLEKEDTIRKNKTLAGNELQNKASDARLKELFSRNHRLRQELDRLRQEMIGLDKEKVSLEKEIYKPTY